MVQCTWVLILFVCLLFLHYGIAFEKTEVENLVRQWAPLIWLSPKEKYFPLSVEEFLPNVYEIDHRGNPRSILGAPGSRKEKSHYLVTQESIDKLRNDSSSFLFGRNPTRYPIPIYAVVTHCSSKEGYPGNKRGSIENDIKAVYDKKNRFYFHVSYWTFYPYNEGKDICFLGRVPTPRLFNTCLGKTKIMGNHVGDWEHMSLLFAGRRVPDRMFLAVHNTGVYYKYHDKGRYFKFESSVHRKGNQTPKFPQVVRMQGEHPVLFAARGSHGLWASPGEHDYVRVPRLTDKNGYGVPWKTWNNINIYHLGYTMIPKWMTFEGKWGNGKRNCFLSQKLGICEYVDGPPGILRDKTDFYC